jgi:chromosome segregation ATPase
MKVTDEMVRRAEAEAVCAKHYWSEEVVVRRMLEAALKDVPEPGEWMAELRTRNARIRELEARCTGTVTEHERELWRMETDRADAAEARVKELQLAFDQLADKYEVLSQECCDAEAKLEAVERLRDDYQRELAGTGQRTRPSDPYWMGRIAEQLTTVLEVKP